MLAMSINECNMCFTSAGATVWGKICCFHFQGGGGIYILKTEKIYSSETPYMP
jgi:hypothetical protein